MRFAIDEELATFNIMNRRQSNRMAGLAALVLLGSVFFLERTSAQEEDSVTRIEREIAGLLSAREQTPGRQENIDKTYALIDDISELQQTSPIESARLLLLLYQYSGAEDGHRLDEMLTSAFVDEPAHVVGALVEIEHHLRPEFRNDGFLRFLYGRCCYYPVAMTDIDGGFDFSREDRRMRERLGAIRNSENEAIINYLVTNVFSTP